MEVLPPSAQCLMQHVRGSYPSFIAHTGSCARPNPSLPVSALALYGWVFAGCCQPLLGDGPSRRYLHNPCVGAWTPTPPRSAGALTRCLPGGHRPHLSFNRFGAQSSPRRGFDVVLQFRGCSHFFMFRLPHLLDPPVVPTAGNDSQAAGPFTPRNGLGVTPKSCGIATCLNRAIGTAGLAPARLWPCRPLP